MFINKLIDKYKHSNVAFKASIWFILVSIVDNAISILTQPFVNRILTVEQVGIFNIYNTWATIIRIVATFNLFCGVYEVFLVDHKDDQNQVRGSLCFLSTIITCSFFLILFIFINPFSSFLGIKPIYLVLMFFFVLSEEIIQFYIVQLRFTYKYVHYSIFVVSLFLIKSVLTVLLSYFFIDDRVFGRILGLTAPMFLVAAIVFIVIIRKTSFRRITSYWLKGLKFNLPLIPHYLSTIVLSSSDKVMIQHLVAENSEFCVGLYSVVYSFSSLSLIVFTAINNSYTPWAYSTLKNGDFEKLKKRTNTIILISSLFCVLLMLFAPEGVLILGGQEYLKALPIVPILIVGTFFSSFYFIFSNVEFINKKTKLVFPITLFGAIVNIGLNWWLIPIVGYEIAAYTTLIGYSLIALSHYIYSRIIAKRDVYDMKTISIILLVLIGCSVGSIFFYRLLFWIRYLIIVGFSAAIFLSLFYIYRKNRIYETNDN